MSVLSRIVLMVTAAAVALPAAESPAKPKEGEAQSQLSEEEKWNFDPQINRADIFYDLETKLMLQAGQELPSGVGVKNPGPPGGENELELLREWGRQELLRVENFILSRKWDDALKATESDNKKLQNHADDAAIAAIIDKLKRYHSQAEEAKIYEEAQAKFDALGLKVEGILWSPAGSLAVIGGEPRARAINERVKDCVIINIDTNRVDFLFHYNRRRFEFQRYVGEDLTSGSKSK